MKQPTAATCRVLWLDLVATAAQEETDGKATDCDRGENRPRIFVDVVIGCFGGLARGFTGTPLPFFGRFLDFAADVVHRFGGLFLPFLSFFFNIVLFHKSR